MSLTLSLILPAVQQHILTDFKHDQQKKLPLSGVRLGQKRASLPGKLPIRNRGNKYIAEAHNSLNSTPPFTTDCIYIETADMSPSGRPFVATVIFHMVGHYQDVWLDTQDYITLW